MGTGWVSVCLSPLFEKSPPPPDGRQSGRLKVPTGVGVATVGTSRITVTTSNDKHATDTTDCRRYGKRPQERQGYHDTNNRHAIQPQEATQAPAGDRTATRGHKRSKRRYLYIDTSTSSTRTARTHYDDTTLLLYNSIKSNHDNRQATPQRYYTTTI